MSAPPCASRNGGLLRASFRSVSASSNAPLNPTTPPIGRSILGAAWSAVIQPCEKPMRTQRRESNPRASSKSATWALTTAVAVANAVADALARAGASVGGLDMPLLSERVWRVAGFPPSL